MSYSAEESPEVVLSFAEALEDLQRTDQYEIENLTMIAKEATEHAQAISQAVESHIRKTRPEYKLPGLYLLDSLVKHIGTPYTVYLGRHLYQTFFSAYTVVDNNTRRAMDDLFRSWTQPAPESRDPRPVFSPDITQPIDSALSKMRDITTPQNRPPPPPANVTFSQGRVITPGAHYSHLAPYPRPSFQTPTSASSTSYQGNHPPFQPPGQVSHQVAPPPSVPPHFNLVPTNFTQQGQYVYSGPPPPTMSHQARLDKLRYDVQGLLNSVQNHIGVYPNDQEKVRLLQNLQSLKTLLDTGSLSLTHIQSTEIVVANIARDLPFGPPTILASHHIVSSQVATSQNPPQQPHAQNAFDPSSTASLVSRGAPQSTISQYLSQIPVSRPSPSAPSPQLLSSLAPSPLVVHAPPSPAVLSLPQGKPPSVLSQTAAQASPASNLGLLEQLRASGLLGSTPTQSTPLQVPATASILSQLMQPQAETQAMNDVKLEPVSLRVPRFHLIKQLYEDKPDRCRQCGLRFPANEQGKFAKGVHIDWHFKVNSRVQDSSKAAVNRSWYIDEQDWIGHQEELSGYSGSVMQGTLAGKSVSMKRGTREQYVFVPTDARLVNLPCSICQEKFEQGWDDETQQPTWKHAVKVGDKYYHATCFAEVSKGTGAAISAVMESTASSSARSTPDPVLGKRRFDDFRFDAPPT